MRINPSLTRVERGREVTTFIRAKKQEPPLWGNSPNRVQQRSSRRLCRETLSREEQTLVIMRGARLLNSRRETIPHQNTAIGIAWLRTARIPFSSELWHLHIWSINVSVYACVHCAMQTNIRSFNASEPNEWYCCWSPFRPRTPRTAHSQAEEAVQGWVT